MEAAEFGMYLINQLNKVSSRITDVDLHSLSEEYMTEEEKEAQEKDEDFDVDNDVFIGRMIDGIVKEESTQKVIAEIAQKAAESNMPFSAEVIAGMLKANMHQSPYWSSSSLWC